MYRPTKERGFTLMELLILLAITAALAAVLVPVMRHLQSAIDRTVDANNIRMIAQASLNYANDHGGNLPGGPLNIHGEILPSGSSGDIPGINALAAALARTSDLNDPWFWISRSDSHPDYRSHPEQILVPGQSPGTLVIDVHFNQSPVSLCYVANLNLSMPPSRPVIFTRGLQANGTWLSTNISVYRNEGGHIAFLGGQVKFYRNVGLTAEEGRLIGSDGLSTNNILRTQPHTSPARFFSRPNSPTGSNVGMSGSGPD